MTSNYAATDEQILKLLADDNPQSILLMYGTYHSIVFKRLNNIVRHSQDAEDIMQDLFLSIWEKRGSLKLVPPIKGYLLAAAHNRALNFLQQKARRKLMPVDVTSEIIRDRLIDQASNRKLLEGKIKTAIRMLPQKTRIVYLLSRNFKMSNLEIARQMNISIKSVEKHITKALKLLRKLLKLSLVLVGVIMES